MGGVAVRAARAVGYVNAGTAEFLVDQERNFYFLEVNARLQVEHPVTEQVTGLDLVRWQLRIAAGEPLALRQEDISFRGHAIECRVYAEDPDNQFFPSTGRIIAMREPSGPGVRVDSGVRPGLDVSLHYDPMLAKLIVWGEDRPMAIDRLKRALSEYLILGLKTDLPLHRFLTRHPAFLSGAFDTGFLEREWQPGAWLDDDLTTLLAVAAVLVAEERAGGNSPTPTTAPLDSSLSWRLASRPARRR
jgi:acetyl/propionyl-CoA carboxylase alpha subunit